MTAVTIYSDFGAWENKVCHYFHCFPIYFPRSDGTRCHGLHFLNVELVFPSICHEVIGPDVMIFVFWMLSFKPTFSLSSFTYIKRLFSSCSLSAIREVLSACLRLLIFLPEILIPACASSSLAFHMMYSAFKLNKQDDNIQHWRILEPVCCSMSSSNCCFLTCIQVAQEAGQVVWYSHLLKSFPVYWEPHTQRLWHSQ